MKYETERRLEVVDTSVSSFGGLGFDYRPEDRMSWLRFSWLYSVS